MNSENDKKSSILSTGLVVLGTLAAFGLAYGLYTKFIAKEK